MKLALCPVLPGALCGWFRCFPGVRVCFSEVLKAFLRFRMPFNFYVDEVRDRMRSEIQKVTLSSGCDRRCGTSEAIAWSLAFPIWNCAFYDKLVSGSSEMLLCLGSGTSSSLGSKRMKHDFMQHDYLSFGGALELITLSDSGAQCWCGGWCVGWRVGWCAGWCANRWGPKNGALSWCGSWCANRWGPQTGVQPWCGSWCANRWGSAQWTTSPSPAPIPHRKPRKTEPVGTRRKPSEPVGTCWNPSNCSDDCGAWAGGGAGVGWGGAGAANVSSLIDSLIRSTSRTTTSEASRHGPRCLPHRVAR